VETDILPSILSHSGTTHFLLFDFFDTKDSCFIKAWRAKIQTTPSRKKQKMNPTGMGF